MSMTNALHIGKTLRRLRETGGYNSRASFVETKALKGKITQEGLRKIEAGERIPKLETLRRLTSALGASAKTVRMLEELALRKHVERATRQAGNVKVHFSINGKPMDIEALPPKRRTEAFVRRTVTDLLEVATKLGLIADADEEFFRQSARSILLKNLSA